MRSLHSNRARQMPELCTIRRRSDTAGQYGAPALVVSDLPCSGVYEVAEREHERGMVTLARRLQLYCAAPADETIREQDEVTVNEETYLVTRSSPWPRGSSATFYELEVEHTR